MKAFLSVLLLTALTTPAVPATPAIAQEWPTIPEPVPVELDPSTTAFLVLDINSSFCAPRPACVAGLPGIASLLERARAAGVPIVYSNATTPGATVLSEVAPQPDEPVVTTRADKFFGTDLQVLLDERGTRTAIIVGTAPNGAVLYTTFSATLRGYTVVVAEDGIHGASTSDFASFLTRWQVLNQPGFDNPENRPLAEGRVTLSPTDLITFR